MPDRPPTNPEPEAAELIEVIDRLEELLHRSDLSELEVEVGGTALVLRTPAALHGGVAPAAPPPVSPSGASGGHAEEAREGAPGDVSPAVDEGPQRHAVLAPLTGLFYTAPSPDAAPYVQVGGSVSVGQVIGLIEAMKLYNEIKSDVAGTVTRIAVENGALVKAKQTLIEVQPW